MPLIRCSDPMKTTLCQLLISLLCLSPLTAQEDGFVPLFNGEDLSGWVVVNTAPSTWRFDENGWLICSGKPIGEIRTERMYQNFIMEIEWRHMVPRGNAGIFVWADDITARGQPFHRGIEVQVLENAYGNNRSHTTHGDIFPIHGATMTPLNGRGGSRAFPTEFRSRPSPEWNHYRIECIDGRIALEVNGKRVTQGMDCVPRKGYLCLESEGGVVHYRNGRIKVLPDTPIEPEHVAVANRGFRSLYTGVDFSGWRSHEGWVSRDWVLHSGAAAGPLVAEAPLALSLGLIVDVRLSENSGAPSIRFGEDAVLEFEDPKVRAALEPTGRWNRLELVVEDGEARWIINGEDGPVSEWPAEGPVTLQIVPDGEADWANVYVRKVEQMALSGGLAGLCWGIVLAGAVAQDFRQEIAHRYGIAEGLPSEDVRAIARVGERMIAWTEDGAVAFEDGRWHSLSTPPQAPGLSERKGEAYPEAVDPLGRVWGGERALAMTVDVAGRTWLACPAGLAVESADGWRFFEGKDGLPYNGFTCGAEGPDGEVWSRTTAYASWRELLESELAAYATTRKIERNLGDLDSADYGKRRRAMAFLIEAPGGHALIENALKEARTPESRMALDMVLQARAEADADAEAEADLQSLMWTVVVVENVNVKGLAGAILDAWEGREVSNPETARLSRGAMRAAVEVGDEDRLREGLRSETPLVRELAVVGVREVVEKDRWGDWLRPLLEDENEAVRFQVAILLLFRGEREALVSLAGLLDSESYSLRHESHEILEAVARQDFGYEPDGPRPERRLAARLWQRWVAKFGAEAELRSERVEPWLNEDEGFGE